MIGKFSDKRGDTENAHAVISWYGSALLLGCKIVLKSLIWVRAKRLEPRDLNQEPSTGLFQDDNPTFIGTEEKNKDFVENLGQLRNLNRFCGMGGETWAADLP